MAGAASDIDEQRHLMVLKIEDHLHDFVRLRGWYVAATFSKLDSNVRQALLKIPRHEFVPHKRRSEAYNDRPLSIGYGQTISQPVIVAVMTQLLGLRKEHRVLEVGTGSGYQAAVLSQLADEVYSIEIVQALGRKADKALKKLGYQNVQVRVGDGYLGWPEAAPFDRIIVTAAPDHIPQPLLDQLRPGGRLVIPVGEVDQDLMVVDKNADGKTKTRNIFSVRFVPLTRK